MKKLLLRTKCMFLVLVIASAHCAFASVESPGYFVSKRSANLVPPASHERPSVKRSSLANRVIYVLKTRVNKDGKGSRAILVLVAVLLSLILAFGVFIGAWGGL